MEFVALALHDIFAVEDVPDAKKLLKCAAYERQQKQDAQNGKQSSHSSTPQEGRG